jgi:putative zinc finger protein
MTHVHEDLGAYVLGSLDEAERARLEEHMASCPECAAAQAELAGLPKLLDLAVVAGAGEEDPLPPAIEERVLDRFARERPAPASPRRRWRPRIVLGTGGALAGAALAAAALLLVFGFHTGPRVATTRYRLALQPASGTPVSARATAGLRSVPNGTAVRLWVHNLPTKPGQVYEVLCSNKKWTASAGTFRTDANGNAYVELTTAAKRGQYDLIRVVRRTAGGTQSVDVMNARLQS